ncbi:MAG: formate-dependent phosphoribosylglycinamide formyltransferase [Propionibacteriaceae bacterium]|jgi:phosphoribosylglycinamide formyltransferase 2|nr:formate-dependent phosphoribosylglycinamide formyltransferase [Propionibacteriaceae bacterium]
MPTQRGLIPPGVVGTPFSPRATRVMLLGSGELGKEVAIELARFGVEVVAVDRYAQAPAMAVAQSSHVVDMLDGAALGRLIEQERPDLIVPEVEAIDTALLERLEAEGRARVAPTARATRLTMDREGVRRLAAEELGLPTSPYFFADSLGQLGAAIDRLGLPCVVKPVMSSSGHGQSVVRSPDQVEPAWEQAQSGGRAARQGASRVIVEGFIDFDYEITLLTVQHRDGVTFLDPVGHLQIDGDYRESWQPQPMTDQALAEARRIASAITSALGGWGIFGVELFVRGDQVIFSEVSPRPHDTGLVTLVSQDLSEFALHARAVLGLPVPAVTCLGPSASRAITVEGHGVPVFHGLDQALAQPSVQIRLFGKPKVEGHRRVAVVAARGQDLDQARQRCQRAAEALVVELEPRP